MVPRKKVREPVNFAALGDDLDPPVALGLGGNALRGLLMGSW